MSSIENSFVTNNNCFFVKDWLYFAGSQKISILNKCLGIFCLDLYTVYIF